LGFSEITDITTPKVNLVRAVVVVIASDGASLPDILVAADDGDTVANGRTRHLIIRKCFLLFFRCSGHLGRCEVTNLGPIDPDLVRVGVVVITADDAHVTNILASRGDFDHIANSEARCRCSSFGHFFGLEVLHVDSAEGDHVGITVVVVTCNGTNFSNPLVAPGDGNHISDGGAVLILGASSVSGAAASAEVVAVSATAPAHRRAVRVSGAASTLVVTPPRCGSVVELVELTTVSGHGDGVAQGIHWNPSRRGQSNGETLDL